TEPLDPLQLEFLGRPRGTLFLRNAACPATNPSNLGSEGLEDFRVRPPLLPRHGRHRSRIEYGDLRRRSTARPWRLKIKSATFTTREAGRPTRAAQTPSTATRNSGRTCGHETRSK